MSKKVVLKLEVCDEKRKQKAMKAVSRFTGVESLAMDMGERKLTVIGNVDPVQIVRKLRKCWCTQILSVGPAKEPEKKDDGKKDDGKKDDGKKDDGKKEDGKKDDGKKEDGKKDDGKKDDGKKDDGKKDDGKKDDGNANERECHCRRYTECYCRRYTECIYVYSCEENPNSCVIS